MASPTLSEIDVLIPRPVLYKMAGEELRQVVLPGRKVLAVIRFVEENIDVLTKFQSMGKSKEEGGMKLSEILETQVVLKLNELSRLLLPESAKVMTDEWCLEHLGPAHYVAFVKTALVQNQLWDVFTRVKGFVSASMEASLRQLQEAREVTPLAKA